MNKLRKKSLYLALVIGLGAAGMAGSAVAVNVNFGHAGSGIEVINPYYTVRNGTGTYVSLTNTTNQPKAVQVRFTEGKNSREVLSQASHIPSGIAKAITDYGQPTAVPTKRSYVPVEPAKDVASSSDRHDYVLDSGPAHSHGLLAAFASVNDPHPLQPGFAYAPFLINVAALDNFSNGTKGSGPGTSGTQSWDRDRVAASSVNYMLGSRFNNSNVLGSVQGIGPVNGNGFPAPAVT